MTSFLARLLLLRTFCLLCTTHSDLQLLAHGPGDEEAHLCHGLWRRVYRHGRIEAEQGGQENVELKLGNMAAETGPRAQ